MPTVHRARIRKLFRWASLSGQVAGMQVAVQGLSAVTGLLIIRALPKEEYAWFTIANSMLATLNLLGDAGVSTAITSIGGRVCHDPDQFSRLLRDCLNLSLRLAIFGLVATAPLFYLLYSSVSAPPWQSIPAILLAAVGMWPSVSTLLLNIANRLHTRIRAIQISEMTGALSRFGLTGLILLGGWRSMLTVLGATIASAVIQAIVARRQTREYFQPLPSGESYRKEVGGFVKSLYANSLFLCIQAQIVTWIIGWLASSNEVADLGALSRLSVIFSVLSTPFFYLAVPSIARIKDRHVLRKRFSVVFAAAIALSIVVLVTVWLFPQPFLWILGSKYMHLTAELPLALAAQGLTMITNLAWLLMLGCGWVRHAWITIITSVLGFTIGAILFKLNTVAGLLSFSICSVLPSMLYCLGLIVFKLSQKPDSQAAGL